VGQVSIVKTCVGRAREARQQILVVVIAETEAAGGDLVAFKAAAYDVSDGFGFCDADIEQTVGEEKKAAREIGRGLFQFVASKCPSACQIGRSAVANAVDKVQESLPSGRCALQRDGDTRLVIKDHEREKVILAKVSNHEARGFFRGFQGTSCHRSASADDQTESDRPA